MSIDALCGYYINAGATVTDYDSHSKIPNNHDAYIVMYVYKDTNGNLGAHYVAAEYDKTNVCFKVYNDIKKNETWDALLPSSYQKIAGQYGIMTKFLFGMSLELTNQNNPRSKFRNQLLKKLE